MGGSYLRAPYNEILIATACWHGILITSRESSKPHPCHVCWQAARVRAHINSDQCCYDTKVSRDYLKILYSLWCFVTTNKLHVQQFKRIVKQEWKRRAFNLILCKNRLSRPSTEFFCSKIAPYFTRCSIFYFHQWIRYARTVFFVCAGIFW